MTYSIDTTTLPATIADAISDALDAPRGTDIRPALPPIGSVVTGSDFGTAWTGTVAAHETLAQSVYGIVELDEPLAIVRVGHLSVARPASALAPIGS